MITLDKIVDSNLTMLREQEAELQKTLRFIQEAIDLFEQQSGEKKPSGKRGRPRKIRQSTNTNRRGRKRGGKPNTSLKKAASQVKRSKAPREGSRMGNILAFLKSQSKPVKSGELISEMFKQQSKEKDMDRFRKLIYPTLTIAYKKGTLKRKKGMIHLPS